MTCFDIMIDESHFVPFHSTDLTGKRVLVLAPHPDDETIGCGGMLALHAQAGDPVKVIFLTNGAKGDMSGRFERDAYIQLRQEEAGAACACLGITDMEFWLYEDRSLAGSPGVITRLMHVVTGFRPELIYVPSPLEFHPDHRAAAVLIWDLSRTIPDDCHVAFYEVNQPFCVNTLVDITAVIAKKERALQHYASQIAERPYDDVSMALSRFRSMTLPEACTHAEGLFFCSLGQIRQIGLYDLPFWKLDVYRSDSSSAGPLVSIIIRTKDRPSLLAQAIQSVVRQTYANIEIIIVNDGGQDVQHVIDMASGNLPVIHIAHDSGKGRAAAANSGLNAASGAYFNFLDDDDVLYPDHVETLVNHLQTHQADVAYTNVRNAYYDSMAQLSTRPVKEEVMFNLDFDADILLFENYIPIMSVMFSRRALSGMEEFFCESLVLFEDWDFWIRLSRKYLFHHVDRITAEYRFFGISSIESSHRQKYDYDESKAVIFDRVKPFMNGRSWIGFLQKGSVGRLQQALKDMRMVMDAQNEELTHLREKNQGREYPVVSCPAVEKTIEALTAQKLLLDAKLEREQAVLQTLASIIARDKVEKPVRVHISGLVSRLASWQRTICDVTLKLVKFDGRYYLLNHPDVMTSGKNPMLHFLMYGIREKRKTFLSRHTKC
ncbi:MAG: PIG-L family deacetylase [Desulfatirhabdiaceae bacterium]